MTTRNLQIEIMFGWDFTNSTITIKNISTSATDDELVDFADVYVDTLLEDAYINDVKKVDIVSIY